MKLLLLASLTSFAHCAALPEVSARQAFEDVIRYMKCDGLFRTEPGVGGYEQGMAAYWKDTSATGPPTQRSIFDMYTREDDYFWNGRGLLYGSDSEGGGGGGTSIWGQFGNPWTASGPPPTRSVVGNATRREEGARTFYNCYADPLNGEFTYEDEKYRTCRSFITCTQHDALLISALGTEETVFDRADKLPKPSDIYSRFNESFNAEKGTCNQTPIEIGRNLGGPCTVTFDCGNNDPIYVDILRLLTEQIQNFGNEGAFKEIWGDCYPDPKMFLFRSMPATTGLIARGRPPPESGRLGYEVAHIKTTITCAEKGKDSGICGVFGAFFALGGMSGPTSPLGAFGGVMTQVGCTLAGV